MRRQRSKVDCVGVKLIKNRIGARAHALLYVQTFEMGQYEGHPSDNGFHLLNPRFEDSFWLSYGRYLKSTNLQRDKSEMHLDALSFDCGIAALYCDSCKDSLRKLNP